MVFLLSSPRAGSTLLRVMLAGHPRLFCPPELNLLFFDTMAQWRQLVGFGHAMDWTEGGLEWAFVELCGIDSKAAGDEVDRLVAADAAVEDVYARLQELCGPRLLVDKTPPYAMDVASLRRAEEMFERPRYIHLVRHPLSVMESILRLRMDRLFGPSLFGDSDVDPHAVAETVWALPNRNLCDFLAGVAPERQHLVRYEDLVREPDPAMRDLCRFLELPYDPGVLEPYDGRRQRMIGGLGDPNILGHSAIDPDLAEAYKKVSWPRRLDPTTHELAVGLGYAIDERIAPAPRKESTPAAMERLLSELAELPDDQVDALLQQLAGEASEEV
jgi:phthiocerol/phenolphthiocerol synthesis type-I polyketide synthase E